MTPEEKPASNPKDESDSRVDAIAGLALIALFVMTMVFWVSQQ